MKIAIFILPCRKTIQSQIQPGRHTLLEPGQSTAHPRNVSLPRNLLLAALALLSAPAMHALTISSAEKQDGQIKVTLALPALDLSQQRLFVALAAHPGAPGSAILPFGRQQEGSTVFLPFQATHLYQIQAGNCLLRRWEKWCWQKAVPVEPSILFSAENGKVVLLLPAEILGKAPHLAISVYLKNLSANDGWGALLAANDPSVQPGIGDQYLSTHDQIDLTGEQAALTRHNRLDSAGRVRIYQLFVRHFGNANPTRKPHGTLAENGCGKFSGINDAALDSLQAMGITHLWLTGVLQQATGTDYSTIGAPADDPDLLKGLAGSPYAIKDYFDVCPDYADDPARRLEEFRALLARIHRHGLRALIDLVPNHVARSHASDIRPELAFGKTDDHSKFFDPANNFFYLTGTPPLRLPTQPGDGRDGLFDGEREFGRVTGNNAVTWTPGLGDWYETVKLNYGYDFTKGTRFFPNATAPDLPIPDTWAKIDAIIAYWQEMGVDGFRCDMSHMIPPEFWKWAIHRARERQPEVFFVAEAYNNDPAKVPSGDPFLAGFGNVMLDLLDAGFNAVYDDPSYKVLKGLYDEGRWANDLTFPNDFLFQNSLRYAENHDEVRIASQGNWGNIGPAVGLPVSTILYAAGSGPVLLYNGQETGEPAAGAEGFGGDDGRSSIFDYWSLPSHLPWINDGKYDGVGLDEARKKLRAGYAELLHRVGEPVFAKGRFFPLNPLNRDNPNFGRLPRETVSGHWLYAFLRHEPESGKTVLVAVNLHPAETLQDVKIQVPGKPARIEVGTMPPLSTRFLELKNQD